MGQALSIRNQLPSISNRQSSGLSLVRNLDPHPNPGLAAGVPFRQGLRVKTGHPYRPWWPALLVAAALLLGCNASAEPVMTVTGPVITTGDYTHPAPAGPLGETVPALASRLNMCLYFFLRVAQAFRR